MYVAKNVSSPRTGVDEMSTDDDNSSANGSIDAIAPATTAPETIVPIDFAPHVDEKVRFTYKFRWLHVTVAVFLTITITAAWFVLTARSVSIEVEPITAQIQLSLIHISEPTRPY